LLSEKKTARVARFAARASSFQGARCPFECRRTKSVEAIRIDVQILDFNQITVA
jgi:hypothetical protein